MNIRQPVVTAAVAIRQSGVIQAHQVQDRGMEIVDVDSILCDTNAVFVRFSIGTATLDSSPRQP